MLVKNLQWFCTVRWVRYEMDSVSYMEHTTLLWSPTLIAEISTPLPRSLPLVIVPSILAVELVDLGLRWHDGRLDVSTKMQHTDGLLDKISNCILLCLPWPCLHSRACSARLKHARVAPPALALPVPTTHPALPIPSPKTSRGNVCPGFPSLPGAFVRVECMQLKLVHS